jgi:hypothetical protein
VNFKKYWPSIHAGEQSDLSLENPGNNAATLMWRPGSRSALLPPGRPKAGPGGSVRAGLQVSVCVVKESLGSAEAYCVRESRATARY